MLYRLVCVCVCVYVFNTNKEVMDLRKSRGETCEELEKAGNEWKQYK